MAVRGFCKWQDLIAMHLYLHLFSFHLFKYTTEAFSENRWQQHQPGRPDFLSQYDITHPVWLHLAGQRSPVNQENPPEAEVKITVEGKELILQLHKNEQLFAPGYKETWYSPNSSQNSFFQPSMKNCFFHGVVAGEEGSSVAVSNCEGLRGMITVNSSTTYLIEPLVARMGDVLEGHAVYRAEQLKLHSGTCGHQHGVQPGMLEEPIDGMVQSHKTGREKRDVSEDMKYVELLIVADHAEFEKHGRDYERTRMKLLEAANYVDKFYKALKIRVALIGLEVWMDRDKISVSENPYSTLAAFLAWRGKHLHLSPNDNAQLVTGISFQGTTIGLAPLKAMCSEYQSGGVNSDHSDSAVGVAATMAHEMGHNFGMSHDSTGCCQAKPDEGGCIMAASTGHPFPRVFNTCNKKELQRYLRSGGGKCLFNLPNTSTMYGGHRCGNGYLEEGEECDCGEVEECSSQCCNASSCTLKAGAECAHGVCCDNCKLKSAGVLCRPISGPCDLPEYCNGKTESCPANFYLMDGTLCTGVHAYCYTGMCLTLEQQCLALWGQGARPAPDQCFQKVNEAGDSFGNCGKDLTGKYRTCQDKDVKCGKIQCTTTASKPLENNAVAIDTTITIGNKRILCRGTHVYRPEQNEDSQGDTLDPGLVMTGTKCGENRICFGGECRNVSFLHADDCSAKCHGHGLCNNNHNCHCDNGWAPPDCKEEGIGGSVDSGPVIGHSNLLLAVLLPALFFFLGVGAAILWYCYKNQPWHKKSPVTPPAPNHPAPPVSSPAAPICVSQQKVCEAHRQVGSRPGRASSPKARTSVVRPTMKPPVPAYSAPHKSHPMPPSKPPTTPNLSPSVLGRWRPEPPSRPPPPCPVTKPTQACQQTQPLVHCMPKHIHMEPVVPPKGQLRNTRVQNNVGGKS